MKKLLSIILSLTMAITMLTAFGLTASAAEVSEKFDYYTVGENNAISYDQGTDTIDSDLYDIEQKNFVSISESDTPYNTYEITKPCVIYAYFECNNKDQTTDGPIQIPLALDYEIALSQGTPKDDRQTTDGSEKIVFSPTQDWSDRTIPIYGLENGDYEYRKLVVTDDDIVNAGGTVTVYFGARARQFRAVSIVDLGQKYATGVRIYTLKGAVAPPLLKDVINPEKTGDSNITMNGETIPAPTYTVTIPENIEFGNVTKKIKSTSDEDAMAKSDEQAVTIKHSNLFDNQKNVTVTVSTDNKIKNGSNEIDFDLFEKSATDIKITSGTSLFNVKPIASSVNTTESKTIYATLDQRLIKVDGTYTGTVTFTVAMADNA